MEGHTRTICGVFCLNKPAGITSRDAVNLVQRSLRRVRLGHAGTLDPLATGVLVVCAGLATRLIPFIQELPKLYRATFLLGRSSPTDDVDGEVTVFEDAPVVTREQVESTLPEFVGTILQSPPVYSAVKIEGRRAYEWARKGAPREPKPRPVEIHSLKLLRYEYPELELEIHCGSGVYVRSIGRDLAQRLGTAAVMSRLTRLAIGHFVIDQAVDPHEIGPHNWSEYLMPPAVAVKHLRQIQLSEDHIAQLVHGQWPAYDGDLAAGQVAAVVDQLGNLVSVVECQRNKRLRPLVNLPRFSADP
ncbi:MAG TPA: tRNA pseudouridine(55) synthase TruB [Thermogutta sp.]|nr:tRNA pseudouridine(55) synthase TruB [Thermogutta sp.]